MVASLTGSRCFFPSRGAEMKRYWIAATILLVGMWPSDAKAYVPGADQSKTDETPAQQAQSPNPSVNNQDSTQAKEPSVAAKTTTTTNAPANPANPSAAASQQKGSYLLAGRRRW